MWSNNHPANTANKAIHFFKKRKEGNEQREQIIEFDRFIIITPDGLFGNISSSGILVSGAKVQGVWRVAF